MRVINLISQNLLTHHNLRDQLENNALGHCLSKGKAHQVLRKIVVKN